MSPSTSSVPPANCPHGMVPASIWPHTRACLSLSYKVAPSFSLGSLDPVPSIPSPLPLPLPIPPAGIHLWILQTQAISDAKTQVTPWVFLFWRGLVPTHAGGVRCCLVLCDELSPTRHSEMVGWAHSSSWELGFRGGAVGWATCTIKPPTHQKAA
jgi:hypothetical protein